jgi:hypothetical protein
VAGIQAIAQAPARHALIARRAANIAVGLVLACALLGLLGAIDNVLSSSADGWHHPVGERAADAALR